MLLLFDKLARRRLNAGECSGKAQEYSQNAVRSDQYDAGSVPTKAPHSDLGTTVSPKLLRV